MGKTCKVAICNQNKSMNHVFEMSKNSIYKDKWNLFNGIFNFKNSVIQIFRKYFKITVHDVVCSKWDKITS